METDQHIEFFWTALEMFTQEELCKFIKFACNQERIPFTCPCKDGGPDTAHVPPYPMKIAPPDGAAGKSLIEFVKVTYYANFRAFVFDFRPLQSSNT